MTRSFEWGAWVAAVGAAAGLAAACSGGRASQRAPTAQAGTTQGASAEPVVGVGPDASKDPRAGAQASKTAPMPKQPEAKELPEVAGRLSAVSQTELRIQTSSQEEVRLKIDPSLTSFDLDGRQATLNDLTPGTEVRASYEEAKGAKQALVVHARTGSAPTSSPPGEARPAPSEGRPAPTDGR
jgi:hypothetical protein